MASFTAVGNNTTISLLDKGEAVAIALSGTYAMTILFQREIGSPGSGAWETLRTYTTANATVGETYTTEKYNEELRLIVSVDTSGTAVATLTDASVLAHGYRTIRDRVGNVLMNFDQEGVHFHGGRVEGIPIANKTRAVIFEDFHGAWAIGDSQVVAAWGTKKGSGNATALATTVANSVNGEVTLTSADDDGIHSANCSIITSLGLAYKANKGGLEMGVRLKISDISEAVCFIGFTDTISTTVELPLFLATTVIDSDATDACGLIYDVDATVDKFVTGGVDTGTDTAPMALESFVPVDATYFEARVLVSTTGVVSAYINGTLIGRVAAAVTPTIALCPAIVIGNRSANAVVATIDYIWVAQNR